MRTERSFSLSKYACLSSLWPIHFAVFQLSEATRNLRSISFKFQFFGLFLQRMQPIVKVVRQDTKLNFLYETLHYYF